MDDSTSENLLLSLAAQAAAQDWDDDRAIRTLTLALAIRLPREILSAAIEAIAEPNVPIEVATWIDRLVEILMRVSSNVGEQSGVHHMALALSWIRRPRVKASVGYVRALHGCERALYHCQAARLSARPGDPTYPVLLQIEASAYLGLGAVAYLQDNDADAEAYYQKALVLFQALDDPRAQGQAHLALGEVCMARDNYVEAEAHYQHALVFSQATDDREGQAYAHLGLGDVGFDRGDYAAAEEYYGRALALYEAIGDRQGMADTLRGLGEVWRLQDEYAAAQEYYGRALALYEVIGDRQGMAHALRGLGVVWRLQGKYTTAREYCVQALALSPFKVLPNCLSDS